MATGNEVWKNACPLFSRNFYAQMRFTLRTRYRPGMIYRNLFLALLLFMSVAQATAQDRRNHEIFPAKPAAQDAIHWDNGYFVINGKPTFISSGSIHYARVPRELWRDRIWRLKMMGFNAVQSYVFWNASEPKEGQWDFSDNTDLDAWLSLLKDMNMYALVRVGPYSCAEWELGGYPSWLTVKPGMIDRELGPSVAYSDPHLDVVEKIVAKHQLNHGGSVFMVQLENEHPNGWGTQVADPYLKHLDDQATRNGIEVPTLNSGVRHRSDPTASDEAPFPADPSPWYTTEFWTGYIGKPTATWTNGDLVKGALDGKIHGTWKIIAFGGAGYNYYMGHGGTNFGYSGSGEPPGVSYDYSAPVGEAGQLHNLYFPARRAAYFAQTFTPLLTGSHNDPTLATCDQPALRVTARTNPTQGSFIMLDHFQPGLGLGAAKTPSTDPKLPLETHVTVSGLTLPHKGSFHVAAAEPTTILLNVPWTPNASFESICTNVLARRTIGSTNYWICYGPAGDSGEVTLKLKTSTAGPSQFDFTYPAGDAVSEIKLDSGDGHRAVLLVMNTEMTNRTWLARDKIYIGPSFVLEDGSMEFPPEGGKATLYAASGKTEMTQPAATIPDLPALTNWSWRDAAPERGADVDTAKWISSVGPQPMEIYDSFQNRYGWYRATLHADKAGPVSLHFGGQSGTFIPYLNGQPGAMTTLNHGQPGSLTFPDAHPGDNNMAVFVKASARSKVLFYGLDGMQTARGLWGGVSADSAPTPVDVSWKKWDKATEGADAAMLAKPTYDDSTWTAVDSSALALTTPRGDCWYRGTFNITPNQIDSMLESPHFNPPAPVKGQRGEPQPPKVIVYLNGQLLVDHTVDVSKLVVAGKNTVLVLIQSRLGGDTGQLSLALWHNSPLAHATWQFHGGLDDLDETAIIGRVTDWSDFLAHRPWQATSSALPNQPAFWKCTFIFHKAPGTVQTVGLDTTGLKAGHVWLNGHNLGESPQTAPMYMPECWIKEGANDLVVVDIYGNKPNQLKLTSYEAFAVSPSSPAP
jgi:beta-galactosidase